MTQKSPLDTHLHVQTDDVFGELKIISGSDAAPIGVIKQLDANSWIGDIAETELQAEWVKVVLSNRYINSVLAMP